MCCGYRSAYSTRGVLLLGAHGLKYETGVHEDGGGCCCCGGGSVGTPAEDAEEEEEEAEFADEYVVLLLFTGTNPERVAEGSIIIR